MIDFDNNFVPGFDLVPGYNYYSMLDCNFEILI